MGNICKRGKNLWSYRTGAKDYLLNFGFEESWFKGKRILDADAGMELLQRYLLKWELQKL